MDPFSLRSDTLFSRVPSGALIFRSKKYQSFLRAASIYRIYFLFFETATSIRDMQHIAPPLSKMNDLTYIVARMPKVRISFKIEVIVLVTYAVSIMKVNRLPINAIFATPFWQY